MTVWDALPILAGPAALVALWRLVHPAPRLVVGDRGILDRGSGWGWIPWDEIEGAYPPGADEGDTLRVRLRVTERLACVVRRRGRLPRDAPLEASLVLRLDLAGTDLNAVELMREIVDRRAGSRPRSARLDDTP